MKVELNITIDDQQVSPKQDQLRSGWIYDWCHVKSEGIEGFSVINGVIQFSEKNTNSDSVIIFTIKPTGNADHPRTFSTPIPDSGSPVWFSFNSQNHSLAVIEPQSPINDNKTAALTFSAGCGRIHNNANFTLYTDKGPFDPDIIVDA
ncbi:MAG: hypothetical protein ACI8WB_000590 [Phenylobacterium sp.]|jgi:hypothetical protein